MANLTRIASGIFGTLSSLTQLPRVAAPPCPLGRQGPPAASAVHKQKITKYTTAYDFTVVTLAPISFETGGYAHPDTMAFFKRFIKYGMSDGISDGAVTEPACTPQARSVYTRRMHAFRTTLSIAIARTTANTLLYGVTTLLVAGHNF